MAYRKSVVAKLLKTAEDHDSLIKGKGYRADSETDKVQAEYQRLRKNATPEEVELFERIYM